MVFELIEYKIVYTDHRNNKEYPNFQIIVNVLNNKFKYKRKIMEEKK